MFFNIQNEYLKNYMEWSYTPTGGTPAYHLAGGLATLSAITNRNFYMNIGRDGKRFTNLWIILIGRSTIARKTTIMKTGERLLRQVYDTLRPPIFPNQYSEQKIINILSEHKSGIMFWSEWRTMLKLMEKSYASGLMELFTELYDVPDDYVYSTFDRGNETLIYPCFSVLGATVPGWITEWLSDEKKTTGGYVQRHFFILEDENAERFYGIRKPKPEIESRLIKNLCNLRTFCTVDYMRQVTMPAERWEQFNAKRKKFIDYTSAYASSLERIVAGVQKVAMLLAIGDAKNLDNIKISEQNIDDAFIVAEIFRRSLKPVLDVGKSKWHEITLKIKKYLETQPGSAARKPALMMSMVELGHWDVHQALITMKQREEISWDGEDGSIITLLKKEK